MPGFSDIAHCDTCGSCTPPCLIGEAESLDNNGSGTWDYAESVGSKLWSTVDSNAFRYSTLHSGGNPWRISGQVSTNDITGPYDVFFRIVGGAASITDYPFAEFGMGYEGSGDYHYVRHRVGKMISGVPSIYALHPWIPSLTTSPPNYPFPVSLADWVLCWDGNRLRSSITYGIPPFTKYWGLTSSAGITCPGNLFAIVTLNTGGTRVYFNNIKLEYGVSEANPTCPYCGGGGCCNSPVPPNMEVEIVGGPGAGTYILSAEYLAIGSTGPDGNKGDSNCGWALDNVILYKDGAALVLKYFSFLYNGIWVGGNPLSASCDEWTEFFEMPTTQGDSTYARVRVAA